MTVTGTGWNVMLDNFPQITSGCFCIGSVDGSHERNKFFNLDKGDFGHFPWHWDGMGTRFGIASLGAFALFVGFLALAYTFLALPVVRYGAKMIFVESVRRKKPDFEWLIRGFRQTTLI